MLSRAALESRPTITTLVYCYSGLVQVVVGVVMMVVRVGWEP